MYYRMESLDGGLLEKVGVALDVLVCFALGVQKTRSSRICDSHT
jgi:hypothetical protein